MNLSSLIKKETRHHPVPFILAGIILLFILLRIPSLIEPSWYGDEGIYQVIGKSIAEGRVLYKEIWDNKPPFLYLIYSLGAGDLFVARAWSLLFGIGSVWVFFLLAQKLFKNTQAIYTSTLTYAVLFGIPILEGNIANSENFMHLPTFLALYLLVTSVGKRRLLHSCLAGVLLSVAFLFKIVAIFDFAASLVILFVVKFYDELLIKTKQRGYVNHTNLRRIIEFLGTESVFIASFLAPIVISIAYYALQGALADYYKAAFSQNVGYVGHGNYFIIPQGLLYLKLVLLGGGILLVLRLRKTLTFAGTVICLWLLFSLFNAFFSARPYTHYLLVLLPSFALLIGAAVDIVHLRKVFLTFVVVVILLVAPNFRFYVHNTSYYINYMQFLSGLKSVESYQAFFDKRTPLDYDLVNFISANTKPDEGVFLWSDSGQIYYLSNKLPPGRYIVAYHITFYKTGIEETKHALAQTSPKYIIDTKHSPELSMLLEGYSFKYKIHTASIYERKY